MYEIGTITDYEMREMSEIGIITNYKMRGNV